MAAFFVDCVMVGCNAAFDQEHFTIADCCRAGSTAGSAVNESAAGERHERL